MKQRDTLKWQMIRLLALGWFIPLTAIVLIFLTVVSGRIDRQTELTINTSMEKAAEICSLRLSDCIAASKEASYQPDIREAWSDYERDHISGELYNKTMVFLAEEYRYNPNFDLTVLIYEDEPDTVYYTVSATGRGSTSRLRYFKDHVLDKILERAEALDTGIDFFSDGRHVYMMRNLMDRTFEPYAVIVMELNGDRIFESLKSVWAYKGMTVWYQDELLLSEDETDGDEEVSLTSGERGREFRYTVDYDPHAVNLERNYITLTFCLMLAFIVPLMVLVFYFFHKKINLPISTLSDASKQIADGKYGVTVPEPVDSSEGEIADLTHNFNLMSEKLSEQFNKIFVEEIALRDANIHALQSQINPHFLNNTLEIINWEARINGEEKVSSMIEALSVMMSATMDRSRQSLISLSEELEYVNAYLYIIECRYQDRFTHSEKVDPALLQVKVPRLIIQPVVENAVEHCNPDATTSGMRRVDIEIGGSSVDGRTDMVIRVINPGEPTEEDREKIAALINDSDEIDPLEERSTRIGIRNVHRRLRMLYGTDSGLSITTDGKGNTISAIIVKN